MKDPLNNNCLADLSLSWCSDRLSGFEAGLDAWRNGVGHHAEVAQCAGRKGDGAVFIFSSGIGNLPFADETQGGVGL